MAVSADPGRWMLAVTPLSASSAARLRVWASRAALLVAWALARSMPAGLAAIPLETLTMRPHLPSSMPGRGHEAEPGGCGDVDGYRGGPLLRVDGRAGSQRPDDCGVVDQHLDRAPPLPDRGERAGDLVLVGGVGGQGERLAAA